MSRFEEKVRLHHAIGEANRLKILLYLLEQKKPVCICCISNHLGKDPSVAFRHIQLLREVGLVQTKKEGSFLYCSLKNNPRTKKLLGD